MKKVVIPDAQFSGEPDVEREALGPSVAIGVYRAMSPADIPEEVWAGADAVLLWHIIHITPQVVAKLTNCKLIVRLGIGYDQIDVEACARKGIAACNVPTYDMTDVANSTIGMALTLTRGLLSYSEALKADLREGWRWEGPPALRRVHGQKFGVIGCGRIGTAVIVRARALGMDVAYYDPYLPVSHEMSLDLKRFPSLEKLLGWADIVSLHTPLNKETRNMINSDTVAAMKRGAILVNCARGGIVDLDALEAGMREGRIAAAALDVFPLEPPYRHPLLDAWARDEDWVRGRLCITPHAAWYSRATFNDLRRNAARTVAKFLLEGKLENCVNIELLEAARGEH